ncbi:19559_t:CDS:1, partial [Racocetra persica]
QTEAIVIYDEVESIQNIDELEIEPENVNNDIFDELINLTKNTLTLLKKQKAAKNIQ